MKILINIVPLKQIFQFYKSFVIKVNLTIQIKMSIFIALLNLKDNFNL